MNNLLTECISCGEMFTARTGHYRCATCVLERHTFGKFGGLLIHGEDDPAKPQLPLTQREWAEVKREFYQVTTTLRTIDEKKAQFVSDAMKAADEMMQQVEQQIGQPLNEMRSRERQLKQLVQRYMEASGRTEQIIKDLLVEVKNEIVNQGNRPLWSQITDKMGDLLGWSKEQLKEFVRANHSLPQFANRLNVTPLPPGRRKLPKPQAWSLPDHSLAKVAEVEKQFLMSKHAVCELATPQGKFFLTRRFVEKNGLKTMLETQQVYKTALAISDTEQSGSTVRVLVEGPCAYDPNTMRAFLAERYANYRYADVMVLTNKKIAIEMVPNGGENPVGVLTAFFDYMIDTFSTLLDAERNRGQVAMGALSQVQGRNQGDLSSDVTDLSLERERHNVTMGSPQEGLHSPTGDPRSL